LPADIPYPGGRFAVVSENELAAFVRSAPGVMRPVGSGHSFSALLPTEGTMASLAKVNGQISHNELQAEFRAGTPMSRMGDALIISDGVRTMSRRTTCSSTAIPPQRESGDRQRLANSGPARRRPGVLAADDQ